MSNDRGLWIGFALGAPLIVVGILDALGDSDRTHPAELARWIVGCALVLDLVALPLALGIGRVVRSGPLRWSLAASATLAVTAWPLVRGYGRRADNPSLLPRSYDVGLAVAVASVMLAAILWLAVERTTHRSARRHRRLPPGES